MYISGIKPLVCLLVLLCWAQPAWAEVPKGGVDDDAVLTASVVVTSEDTDPTKNAHYPQVKTTVVNGQHTMIEIWLSGHSNRENQNIEGFRIYRNGAIVTKYLMKSEFHPYHFIAYLDPQKFPKGTPLTLVTYCTVDGAFKRDFVVE